MCVYRQGYILFIYDQTEGNTLGNVTHPILDHLASLTDFKSAVIVIFFLLYLKKINVLYIVT